MTARPPSRPSAHRPSKGRSAPVPSATPTPRLPVSALLLRGALAALTALGIALAITVVPALATQVAATRSSATVLDAVLLALNTLTLSHGSALMLHTGALDGAFSLTPFGLTLLLMLINAVRVRASIRRLPLVTDSGKLQSPQVRAVTIILATHALSYALGLSLIASASRSPDVSSVVTSAGVAGFLVAACGGVMGLAWVVNRQRRAHDASGRVLDLLPAPAGAVLRAVLIALIGLAAAGFATLTVMLAVRIQNAAALWDALDPGIVGGIVLMLVHLALLPLFAVWVIAVLFGGTVSLGTGTAYSLGGAETGVLPALPILGILPQPGDFPDYAWLLLLLPAVAIGVGAVQLVRDTRELPTRMQVGAWIAYPVFVIALVMLIAGLSRGDIGNDRLAAMGPKLGTLFVPVTVSTALATAVVVTVMVSPLLPWINAQIAKLRTRVEAEEQRDRERRGETSSEPAEPAEAAEAAAPVSPRKDPAPNPGSSSPDPADTGTSPAP